MEAALSEGASGILPEVPASFEAGFAGGTPAARCLRISCVTLNSIGSPWQSQPGIYGALNPRSVLYLTMMSLRILLSAVPMCTSPLAKGGQIGRASCRERV